MRMLSERMHPEPPPNVLIKKEVSLKLRNQVRHKMRGYLDHEVNICYPVSVFCTNDEVESICYEYEFNKGIGPYNHYSFEYLDKLLMESKPVDFLDLVDITCNVLHNSRNFKGEFGNEFEEDLDEILRRNHMGYRVGEGELIPITDPAMAEEVIMPAFRILHRHGLDKARGELLAAFRHYGDGDYPGALSSAYKALETVIETCLNKKSVDFDPREKTTAKIDRLVRSGIVPNHLQDSMNSLSKMLGAVGNVRNNMSGHGSATERTIPESLVQYQLDMAASSILYLVRSVFGD